MKSYQIAALVLVCMGLIAGCSRQENITTKVTAENHLFEAEVLEVGEQFILVEPLEGTEERKSADQISISTGDLGESESLEVLKELQAGDLISIGYQGGIAESYPAQIHSVYQIRLVGTEEKTVEMEKLEETALMVKVNDELYVDSGKESTLTARCGTMDGEITSAVARDEMPQKNNQSNFGEGYGYQYSPDGSIEIYMNGRWMVFEKKS